MPAPFSRRADGILRAALACAGGAALGCPALLLLWMRTPEARGQHDALVQPVRFDHRHHVRDDGIDCRYCHAGAERGPYAGVPPASVCMGCHAQVWPASPALAAVRESDARRAPIAWTRVHALPDFVFFDHAIHLRKGVACVECHGRVDRMAQVYQTAPLTMEWCLDCHRDPAPHLTPRADVTAMERRAGAGDAREEGAALAARYGVRSRTDCSTCHR